MEGHYTSDNDLNYAGDVAVNDAEVNEYAEEITEENEVNASYENVEENPEIQDFSSEVQEQEYTVDGEQHSAIETQELDDSEIIDTSEEAVAAVDEDYGMQDITEEQPDVESEEVASETPERVPVTSSAENYAVTSDINVSQDEEEIVDEEANLEQDLENEQLIESHETVENASHHDYEDTEYAEQDQVVEQEVSHEESYMEEQDAGYEEVEQEVEELQGPGDEGTDQAGDSMPEIKVKDGEELDNEEVVEANVEDVTYTSTIEPDGGIEVGAYAAEEESKNDDDNEYEEAVEVEEAEADEDQAEENVAQHVSDSDEEQDVGEDTGSDGVALGHVSDDDVRDSDDETTQQKDTNTVASQEAIAKMFDSDSDDADAGEKKEGVGELIHDIFGESEDEDEEFTGFGEEDVKKASKAQGAIISDSDVEEEEDEPVAEQTPQKQQSDDDDDDEGVRDKGTGLVYDFDIMMQKKKAERKGRRKRDGGTFISDSDDIIGAMLTKMKAAADMDREANQLRKPALHKLKMFPTVVSHLKKQDLKEAFVDMGMVAAIADWLSLLPDRSLPHLSIRTELLRVLHDLPPVSEETLKTSGIGRSVMILFKHPRETRQNRDLAGRLINKWSRPIFGLNDNFKSMSRGEREQRDLEQMPQAKRRRLSTGQSAAERDAANPEAEQEPLRPGDKGFVMRARVPVPSHKDYVVRPKWNIDGGEDDDDMQFKKRGKAKSRKDARLEKHIKTFADRKKSQKMQRAVGISLEGSKMPLT